MIYRFLLFFATLSVSCTCLDLDTSYAQSTAQSDANKTSGSTLAHKSPSSNEDVAFTYFSLTHAEPNFTELAFNNGKDGRPYKGAKVEINRLQDLLARIEPREDYIIIHDISDFTVSEGSYGEVLFNLTDINTEYFHRYHYQDLNFMLTAKDIQTLSPVELSDEALKRFLKGYDEDPTIAFALHIKTNFASKEQLTLEDEKPYNLITGDIAYMAYLDRKGIPIWEYKAPWYGHSVQNEVEGLYHRDKVNTVPEVDTKSGTIKDLYNER